MRTPRSRSREKSCANPNRLNRRNRQAGEASRSKFVFFLKSFAVPGHDLRFFEITPGGNRRHKRVPRQIFEKEISAPHAATTDGDRIGVPAYGRVGENDVVKPRSPERNPRENARSSMTVERRSQKRSRLSRKRGRHFCRIRGL